MDLNYRRLTENKSKKQKFKHRVTKSKSHREDIARSNVGRREGEKMKLVFFKVDGELFIYSIPLVHRQNRNSLPENQNLPNNKNRLN